MHSMTPEEKDLINQIRSEDTDLKTREKAFCRLGEMLEETYILDLLPSKAVLDALVKLSTSKTAAASLKRKAKSLVKAYKI